MRLVEFGSVTFSVDLSSGPSIGAWYFTLAGFDNAPGLPYFNVNGGCPAGVQCSARRADGGWSGSVQPGSSGGSLVCDGGMWGFGYCREFAAEPTTLSRQWGFSLTALIADLAEYIGDGVVQTTLGYRPFPPGVSTSAGDPPAG